MMTCESPFRRSVSMESPPLSAVGHEAQLSAPRSPARSPLRRSTSLESPIPLASMGKEAQVLGPRSPSRRSSTPQFGSAGHKAQTAPRSPSRRPHPTDGPTLRDESTSPELRRSATVSPCRKYAPIEEPDLSAVGHEAQLVTPARSPRRRINTASLRDQPVRDRSRRVLYKVDDFESRSQNSGVSFRSQGNCKGVFGALPSNPWVLHFSRDVKSSAFDEQVRGQLRTTAQSYKLGHLLESVDVGTYAKLSSASVHDLIKLINHKLQNVKVHKKPCEDLFHYLKRIDESLLSLFKSADMANLSQGVHRLLGMLKECVADTYILVKRCETRSPIHPNFVANIPAKLYAIEGEIQRILPVLRLAMIHHQDMLASQANMERVAFDNSGDDGFGMPTRYSSAASTLRSCEVKDSHRETQVSEDVDQSVQKSGPDRRPPSRFKNIAPWHLDVHPLKMHRREAQTYLCKACHQLGKGCVFSCNRCNYHVHPGCVELNEAIQQLEEIRINKLSMIDDSGNSERDLCGVTR